MSVPTFLEPGLREAENERPRGTGSGKACGALTAASLGGGEGAPTQVK